ncbi:MAG: ABC transporter substrate-binding protein, partial [Actinomycetes bacterium]
HDDPAKAAEVARTIVADGRLVGVIGHQTSAASQAAGPIYAAAKIPVITPTATNDSVTAGNPWYFRTVFNNTSEGIGANDYGKAILGGGTTAIVHAPTPYGTTLAQGYRAAYAKSGKVVADVEVPLKDLTQPADGAVDTAVAKVVAAQPTGPIFVAAGAETAVPLVKGLRAAGLKNVIMGADTLAYKGFYDALAQGAGALAPATLYSVTTATPLVTAGLTGEAVTFYDSFSAAQGYEARWEAGLTHDALDVFAEAITRQGPDFDAGDLPAARQQVRDQLDLARTPETAFKGLTLPIYFDTNGSAVRPVAWQVGEAGKDGSVRVDAGWKQLVGYSPEAGVTPEQALASGSAVKQDGRIYTVQRIVDVGVNLNQVSNLNTGTQTYEADFFLWLKYPGTDDAANIYFVNSVDPNLKLGAPVRRGTTRGETYVLYQVQGKFASSMQFQDFPFDKQNLIIQLGNRTLPAARVAYTSDPELLAQSQATRMESGVDAGSTIDKVPNWSADSVSFYPASIGNTSAMGDPAAVSGPQGVTYSQFVTSVEISRDVASFLVKNILPLALLVLVTFISLWLPFSEGTRITFAVTGILTGAVMLNSVTSSLANVDYTVAIEWAYYSFIALSGIMLLMTMIGRRLNEKRRLSSLRKLDSFTKIFFGMFVLCTISAYVIAFG